MNPAALKARAKLAATARHSGTDDPRIPRLRTDLAAARLEEHIKAVVDAWPPLTTAQRDKLALLLNPGTGHAS